MLLHLIFLKKPLPSEYFEVSRMVCLVSYVDYKVGLLKSNPGFCS